MEQRLEHYKRSSKRGEQIDFIHKLGVAQKECDESIYWLELLNATNYLNEKEFKSISNEAFELLKMIRSAIITTKKTYNS